MKRYAPSTCSECGLRCEAGDHIAEYSRGEYVKYNEKKEEAYHLLLAYAESKADFEARPFVGELAKNHGWDGKSNPEIFLASLLFRAVGSAKAVQG